MNRALTALLVLATASVATCPARAAVFHDHDFANGVPPYWIQYATGTGQVSVVNGAARFTVLESSSTCCYSDAEINDWMVPDPLPWLYVNVDLRLRTSNTNGLDGGTGAGSRGWGFWDRTANNTFWFLSVSPESTFNGYWASSRANGMSGVSVDVGADMTQWHDYRLVWRPTNAEFYRDGQFVASEPAPPSVRMGLVFWIDNNVVTVVNGNVMVGRLDLPEDQFLDLDWVRIYTSRARFTDVTGSDVSSYPIGGTVTVTLDDPDQNLDRMLSETAQVTVSDASSGDSETMTLTETGLASGEFRSPPLSVQSGTVMVGNGILETQAGNTVSLAYVDADDATDTDADTAAIAAPVLPPVFTDNFGDNTRSPFWGFLALGSGPTVNETGGRLQITIPAGATPPGGGIPLNAGFLANCALSGDFDVQVGWESSAPPTVSGSLAMLFWPQALTGPLSYGGVSRSFSPGNYITFVPFGSANSVPTSDTAGKLRLVRTGGSAQGYYDSGGSWVAIGAPIAFNSADTRVSLHLSQSASSATTAVGEFDDFAVANGTLICPMNQVCGDGTIQAGLGEACDDGNGTAGDGCCGCDLEPLGAPADAAGGWQLNVSCPLAVTTVQPVTIDQTPGTGALTITPSACGTLSGDDGQIHPITSCNLSPGAAQLCGSAFAFPPAGVPPAAAYRSDIVRFDPFASSLGTCDSPMLHAFDMQFRLNGTVSVDGANRAVQIDGAQDLYQITLLNAADEPCAVTAGSFCSFDLRRNEVGSGTDVTVEPLAGASVSFANITNAMPGAQVIVTPETVPAAALPPNFQLLPQGPSATPLYYEVHVAGTITHTGLITVCLPYLDENDDGVVDNTSPAIDEDDLKLLHEEGGSFVDRTRSTPPAVDPVNNQVCGEVPSLSQFVLGSGDAPTTMTPVNATKLIVVDRGANGAKAVFVAKDGAITKGAGTDTATIAVTLSLAYSNGTDPATAGQFVAAQGSPNWLANKTTVAKYVNKTAPTGGGARVVVVKPRKLVKLVGKNLGDTPIDILNQSGTDTGVANTAYCVDNEGYSDCFCSTFTTCAWRSIGGGTGAKVVCRTGAGDTSCAALP